MIDLAHPALAGQLGAGRLGSPLAPLKPPLLHRTARAYRVELAIGSSRVGSQPSSTQSAVHILNPTVCSELRHADSEDLR
jgi:hypothetical protein